MSASNDVSMHFQGCIEEPYSSIPQIQRLHFEICLHLINLNGMLDFLPFIDAEQRRGNIKRKLASRKSTTITRNTDHSANLQLLRSVASIRQLFFQISLIPKMSLNSSISSTDSDVFYVEQSPSHQSVPRPNTPIVFNSTEISGDDTREIISISSIASPEPQIVTINDDSNEITMPYAFGRQLPIVPPPPA